MKGSFKLGKVAGIGIFIHWTFSLLILFIIYINYKSGQNTEQIIWSVAFILCIFITVLLHELGHALAAKNYNITTKDITLLPIGGLARLERIPEKPSEELIVAFAGPLVNITLAFITGIFITIPDTSEQLMAELSHGINANNFFLNFFLINFWLALFNLIPAFPMDGGRILRALLSFKLQRHVATRISARIGQLLAMAFILFGFFTSPFLIFIGIFVIIGAQVEADYTESKFMLKGFKVQDVVMKNYPTIDANEKIKTAVALVLDSQNKNFLITEDTVPVGTLNRDQIITALSEKGANEFIYNVMDRNLVYLDSSSLLENIFELIQLNKSRLMLVMENNELVGTLDIENLMEFILINEVKINNAHDEKKK
ncbi:site-2 protease family protein [Flavobacterium gawalongense]|uniref:Zinc metalloprotease n=1 Tax=Flavobacterium gawalongense TaxID=2594432 RepID=A0ABY3CLG0_9FLAO|nr:site-2 protease family protein [Flavobacterium gawalongense]TRX03456.1 CBS domain-containing protein [Flavobacterium gawalongense]TRX06775.1 CBS domain-containing protein [Flavobacterium gawalongense]